MTAIVLIPARKGSKRIPGKNVKPLLGKPLVQYSIEHGLAAERADAVVVTTDDEEVEAVARRMDCRIIRRPPELASDTATTLSAIQHAVREYRRAGNVVDVVILLQPTVPLRDPAKIDEAIELLERGDCDSVISHVRVDYFHPNRMKKIEEGKIVPYAEPEVENVPRSELPAAYYRDGSIYGMRADLPLEQGTVFGRIVLPLIHRSETAVNIDTETDWWLAEKLLEKYDSFGNARR